MTTNYPGHDTDPTPPHGTPRPTPCAAYRCENYARAGFHYCGGHSFLSEHDTALDFLDAWLDIRTDRHSEGDSFARLIIDHALNNLYASFIAWRDGDGEGTNARMETTADLLGFATCDTCGDYVGREEIDVNGMCGNCRDEVEYGEGVRCRRCGFTLSSDYVCACPEDDQRTAPDFFTTCNACGEMNVPIVDDSAPELCEACEAKGVTLDDNGEVIDLSTLDD